MTPPQETWTLHHHQLTAPGPLASVTAYQSLLQTWQTFSHPALLPIEAFHIDRQAEFFTVSLEIPQLSAYQVASDRLAELSTLEKLHLLQQSLDVLSTLQEAKLPLVLDLSHLWIHRIGLCGWLPPAPLAYQPQHPVEPFDYIRFLLNLLDYGEDWGTQEKHGSLPWAWGSFIEQYQRHNQNPFPDQLHWFRFLFFQAWFYLLSNRLAMKDKLLAEAEYVMLHTFGKQLGLTEAQMEQLDVIAQQQAPERSQLLAVATLNGFSKS